MGFFWRLLFLSLWFITYCRYCHLGEIIVADLDEMTYENYEADIIEKIKNIAAKYSVSFQQEPSIGGFHTNLLPLYELVLNPNVVEEDKNFIGFFYRLNTIKYIYTTFCKYDLDFLNPAAHTIEKLVSDPTVPLTDCSVFLTVLQNYATVMDIARELSSQVEQLYPIPQYKILGIPFRHVFVEDAHRFLTGRRFKVGESYDIPESIIAQELETFYSEMAEFAIKDLFKRYDTLNNGI
jgi:hypothetical protein